MLTGRWYPDGISTGSVFYLLAGNLWTGLAVGLCLLCAPCDGADPEHDCEQFQKFSCQPLRHGGGGGGGGGGGIMEK